MNAMERARLSGGWPMLLYNDNGTINESFAIEEWPVKDQVDILKEIVRHYREKVKSDLESSDNYQSLLKKDLSTCRIEIEELKKSLEAFNIASDCSNSDRTLFLLEKIMNEVAEGKHGSIDHLKLPKLFNNSDQLYELYDTIYRVTEVLLEASKNSGFQEFYSALKSSKRKSKSIHSVKHRGESKKTENYMGSSIVSKDLRRLESLKRNNRIPSQESQPMKLAKDMESTMDIEDFLTHSQFQEEEHDTDFKFMVEEDPFIRSEHDKSAVITPKIDLLKLDDDDDDFDDMENFELLTHNEDFDLLNEHISHQSDLSLIESMNPINSSSLLISSQLRPKSSIVLDTRKADCVEGVQSIHSLTKVKEPIRGLSSFQDNGICFGNFGKVRGRFIEGSSVQDFLLDAPLTMDTSYCTLPPALVSSQNKSKVSSNTRGGTYNELVKRKRRDKAMKQFKNSLQGGSTTASLVDRIESIRPSTSPANIYATIGKQNVKITSQLQENSCLITDLMKDGSLASISMICEKPNSSLNSVSEIRNYDISSLQSNLLHACENILERVFVIVHPRVKEFLHGKVTKLVSNDDKKLAWYDNELSDVCMHGGYLNSKINKHIEAIINYEKAIKQLGDRYLATEGLNSSMSRTNSCSIIARSESSLDGKDQIESIEAKISAIETTENKDQDNRLEISVQPFLSIENKTNEVEDKDLKPFSDTQEFSESVIDKSIGLGTSPTIDSSQPGAIQPSSFSIFEF